MTLQLLHRFVIAAASVSALLHAGNASAAAPTTAPQVLLTITNSESMDGTTAGAIMVGSGSLSGSGYSFLNSSSSPVSYSVPTGFTPPVSAASNGVAPYTAACGSYLCDNGASRMNMTKAAIQQVLTSYANQINFGLYAYKTGSPTLYTTWVYQMSAAGGFTFTNTASASTISNPCYNYTTATGNVASDCAAIAGLYSANVVKNNAYMVIGASSDNAQINDVLYAGTLSPVFVDSGTITPANPITAFPLSVYNANNGSYLVKYGTVTTGNGGGGACCTSPTNAGYVPYSTHVLYSQRGFGYGASQDATTGAKIVSMGTDPSTSTAFTTALAPETNNASSSEMKSVAGQSGIGGLLTGAKSYLGSLTVATCQSQYVVLMTDGLPTLDTAGKAWPPLGTVTGNAYGLTATFNSDGSFNASNSQAVTDAVNAVKALKAAGVTVYVIGLGAGVDSTVNPAAANLLQAMALAGGSGSYFPANDPTSLAAAFQVIVQQIYSASTIAAPVAPVSVSSGTAYEYLATSTTPPAGHVAAYRVDANGVEIGTTSSWQAEALMTTTNRTSVLSSNLNDANKTVTLLSGMDAAVYSLATTTCVPNVATIQGYTITPTYTSGACASSVYLAGRNSGSFLGAFSTQNSIHLIGPPSSSALSAKYAATYNTYESATASRPSMLMFTNQDGFLYSLNATTGALLSAWTSRSNLAKMQNYGTFAASGSTDGNFMVADAMDGSGTWGSYVVGSLQSGAEHFSLKLNASGLPTNVIYDQTVTGSAAGDKVAATGNAPLRQPPFVAYIGNSAYSVYVVTNGSVSTLYETNVATGVSTSQALTFQVSSALYLDASTNQLWMGGTNGTIWYVPLGTGVAATDLLQIHQAGTTVNPATGSTLSNVQWVASFKVNGQSYFYAMNASQLTLFGVAATGWVPLWATTPSAGYVYTSSGWAASSTVTLLTTNSVVSDMPTVIGGALVIPVYVAGSGCNLGTGYYDYFYFKDGTFPTNALIAVGLTTVVADQKVGVGIAYTASFTLTANGYVENGGSKQSCTTLANCGPTNQGTGAHGTATVSWRRY